MFTLESFSAVVAFVGNIGLALFPLYKNIKSHTNRLFFLFTLSMASYILINFLALHQDNDQRTFLFIKLVMILGLIINGLFFFLVSTFPKQKMELKKGISILVTLSTVLSIPLVSTNLIFAGVSPGTTQPVPGPMVPVFLLHTVVLLGGGVVVLLLKLRKAVGVERTQIHFFLLGAAVMFVGILITNVFFVIALNNTDLVGLLPLYTLAFVGFISYSIVKHHFLDIRLIVARSIAYFLLIAFMAAMYAFGLFFVGEFLSQISSGNNSILISVFLALIMVITFQPIKKFLEKTTNGVFYQNAYDLDELLYMLSQVMSSSLTLKVLTENVMEMLRAKLHVVKIEIFVLDQKGKSVLQTVPAGQPPYDLSEENIALLEKYGDILIFDELVEGEVKELMRSRDISIFLKLKTTHRMVGFLILGNKISGEIYFDQDIKTLQISAPQFAVAVENALAFEEIREFNRTLQEEVDKATADLVVANEKLKEVDQLKDEFISIASHDLRTPLTTVKNFLWLTLNKSKLDAKTRDNLDRAYNAADRTAMLVADMLDVSRIEGNRIELKMEQLSLCGLMDEVNDELASKAKAKNVNFSISCSKDVYVIADRERLLQVIINLADNAIKFTPSKGKVAVNVSLDGEKVAMAISDTGVGIEQKDFPRLFTKFGRLHNTLSSVPEAPGTGLGLYISKKMVDLLGGTIDVQSKVGKGTTFTCIFKKA